jgi:hypothetical protein
MTHEEREQLLNLVHGLQDRLLYLNEEERTEFLRYIDALYLIYPVPRKVLYGAEALKNQQDHGE